ncbi:MAG TPA: NADH-quinone oxidoreductase subunit L [Candidatus Limnocylindria bacterium]|nr:NADH-quinone oxidoreductase subunit L [Candidatus Limnocylindria bacterium]
MTLVLLVGLPLAGAVVVALFGGLLSRRANGAIATAALALSFGAGIALARAFAAGKTSLVAEVGPWLPIRGADLTLRIDPLTMPLALMVAGVSALICLYSVGYLAHDAGAQRYFAALDLFVFAMLLIVVASNLLLLFAGWELVGLCSYLLIAHWRERPAAAAAGVKAFVVNRVGDAAFLVGIFAIFVAFQTVDIGEVAGRVHAIVPAGVRRISTLGPDRYLLVPSALLLVGALAKSAQLPLHVWLPDAMEGPTPVSALIHAATMVTAGVVLLLRLAPILDPSVLLAAAIVGAATALFAAVVALAQTDHKRVLAWSTISQVGLMFVGAGAGAAFAAAFHLVAHALFKAALFLGSGSVMHATDDELDVRRLGGLAKRLPLTTIAFACGALGLAAIPPAAGFFSKEAIAAAVLDRPILLVAVIATSPLTALYVARLFALVFVAPAASEEARHAHESPALMLVPLLVFAAGALAFGILVASGALSLGSEPGAEPPLALSLVSASLAVAGAAAGVAVYARGPRALVPVRAADLARSGFAMDALYARSIVAAFRGLALALETGSERVVQGSADLVGRAVSGGGAVVRRAQGGYVRVYEAMLLAAAVVLLAYWSLR